MTAKDIISRDILEHLTTDLARHLLGLDGEAVELLETEEPAYRGPSRRRGGADAGQRRDAVPAPRGDRQLEQRPMPLRMLRYYTDIRFAGHAGPLRQFLLYIGTAPLGMPDGIDEPGLLDDRFGVVDMHRVNCAGLLVQDNPDVLVLAVLCDFDERAPEQGAGYIVRRLEELLGADEHAFRGYMTMLEILSENRDLQVREAERMLTQVDVRRLPSYELGYEAGAAEGEARGKARGEARGEARGRAESQRAIVRQLLRRLDPTQVAELLDRTPEEVVHMAENREADR